MDDLDGKLNRLYDEGDYQGVIDAMKALSPADIDDELRLHLVRALLSLNRLPEAEGELQKFAAKGASWHFWKGRILFSQKQFAEAAEAAEKGLGLDPAHEGCHYLKENSLSSVFTHAMEHHYNEGSYQKIIDAILALPVERRTYEVEGWVGLAYIALEDYTRGEDVFLSLGDEGREDPLWHYQMGRAIYFQDGREEEALAHFERSLELNPGDEAIADYIEHCKRVLLENKISKWIDEGEYQKVVYAVGASPGDPGPVNKSKGICALIQLNEWQRAEEEALALEAEALWDHPVWCYWMIQAWLMLGKPQRALAAAERAAALYPDDEDFSEAIAEAEEDILETRFAEWDAGEERRKIVDTILAMPEDKRSYNVKVWLAISYNNLEELDRAEEVLLSIEEEGKEDSSWYYYMGYAYQHRRDFETAKKYFAKSLEMDPESDIVLEAMDDTLKGKLS